MAAMVDTIEHDVVPRGQREEIRVTVEWSAGALSSKSVVSASSVSQPLSLRQNASVSSVDQNPSAAK